MTHYENTSKKLLEDYARFSQKLGGRSNPDPIDASELVEIEAFVKWRTKGTVGAKSMYLFDVLSWRPAGAEDFVDRRLRAKLLLSAKTEVGPELTGDITMVHARGYFSHSRETLLLQSVAVVPIEGSHKEKLASLLEEKTFVSDHFGKLTYDIRGNAYRGEFVRNDRAISVELRDTSPDQVAEQINKLALFVSDDGVCERACVDLLRGHRKVQDLSTSDAEITLSGLSLNSNSLMASFHVRPGIDFANVRGFLTDGRFERLSVAEVERFAGP